MVVFHVSTFILQLQFGVVLFLASLDSNPSKCDSPVDCRLPPAGRRQLNHFIESNRGSRTEAKTTDEVFIIHNIVEKV